MNNIFTVFKKTFLAVLVVVIVFGSQMVVHAQLASPSPGNSKTASPSPGNNQKTAVPGNSALNIHLNNPLTGISTIPEAINKILSIVIRIALPLIIIMFIYSGIQFITARGNPKKIEEAKNMFFYTVIGTLLVLGAWTITNAIVGTVNNIIN